MNNIIKQIDYIQVYHERKVINGVLYPRYFIHEGTPIGIPSGISFYSKNLKSKYIRLSSTESVKGMMIRYRCKHSQVQALLKLTVIKNLQKDNKPTTVLRADEKRYGRHGINETMPSGVCVTTRTINGHRYHRIAVNVFCTEKNKFIAKHLHAGKVGDEKTLRDTIKRAIELRKSSLALTASLTQINAPKAV